VDRKDNRTEPLAGYILLQSAASDYTAIAIAPALRDVSLILGVKLTMG